MQPSPAAKGNRHGAGAASASSLQIGLEQGGGALRVRAHSRVQGKSAEKQQAAQPAALQQPCNTGRHARQAAAAATRAQANAVDPKASPPPPGAPAAASSSKEQQGSLQ